MGGTIGLESRLGEGSRFFFELSLQVLPRMPLQSPSAAEHASLPSQRLPGGTALVVDDNPVNRLVAVKMLERLGYRTEEVSNGCEALRQMERTRYDVVLMDCNMPVMDGYQAARAIRERASDSMAATPADVTVIGLTAYALHGDREKCLDAGMDDYLAKPVTLEGLRCTLARWLGASEVPPSAGPGASTASPDGDHGQLREYLAQLAASVDRVTVRGVLQLFLSEMPQRRERIEQAGRADDVAVLAREMHKLAGSCATLGARRLSKACLQLEDLCRSAGPEQRAASLAALRPELAALVELLAGLLPSYY
jgi:CheY-like chemotaxis protein